MEESMSLPSCLRASAGLGGGGRMASRLLPPDMLNGISIGGSESGLAESRRLLRACSSWRLAYTSMMRDSVALELEAYSPRLKPAMDSGLSLRKWLRGKLPRICYWSLRRVGTVL